MVLSWVHSLAHSSAVCFHISHFPSIHQLTIVRFAGKDESWAPPKDQRAYFADISGALILA